MTKLYGTLKIMGNLEYRLVFDVVPLILYIKVLGHPNEILEIIVKVPYPLPLGSVEEFITSCIGDMGKFFIFLDGINRTPYIFSIVPWPLELPIPTWKFLLSIDLVKYLHLGSIPIDRFECVYEVICF